MREASSIRVIRKETPYRGFILHVKTEIADIAVFDDIIPALEMGLAL
jgi:hypothetical protein